jgi:hypothetical protein
MGLFAYLREQRMKKAAELLVYSNKTVKEIEGNRIQILQQFYFSIFNLPWLASFKI